MKESRFFSVFFLCLVLVASLAANLGAEELTTEEETLVGIRELKVVVLGINEGVTGTGLTEEDIRTIVELKLRLAGIKISDSNLVPGLVVILSAINVEVSENNPHLVYSFELSIHQDSILIRDPSILVINGKTWDTGTTGITPKEDFKQKIKSTLNDLMDSFLNDYLKANPR